MVVAVTVTTSAVVTEEAVGVVGEAVEMAVAENHYQQSHLTHHL